MRFNNFDVFGNISQQQKETGIPLSYIWDYNTTYPVAKINDAVQTGVAYTSFEAEGKGGWTYTGAVSTDASAPTGRKSYVVGNSITKSGLNASATYVVSYWKKSGTVSVNGTTAVTGRTLNGWTYHEHKVVNPSGGLITISGTNGVIDELRLYPAAAQMTTYTYDPLVGMTSQCDANNRITYFEYDAFSRLNLVRDHDKKILKKICYNYAGQPENCITYYNTAQSGLYFKSGCFGCLVGSSVLYTVQANTYSSTISQANADQ